jgi:D-arabinose 5-phosphate isomerase GutQ
VNQTGTPAIYLLETDAAHPAIWARSLAKGGALRVISDGGRNEWILQRRQGVKRIYWKSIAFCGTKVGLVRAVKAAGGFAEDVERFPEYFSGS